MATALGLGGNSGVEVIIEVEIELGISIDVEMGGVIAGGGDGNGMDGTALVVDVVKAVSVVGVDVAIAVGVAEGMDIVGSASKDVVLFPSSRERALSKNCPIMPFSGRASSNAFILSAMALAS